MEQNSSTDEPAMKFPHNCPSRQVMELLADKWKLLLIHTLAEGEIRNGALKRAIEGISQKMLTQTLRSLERDGLVQRIDYGTVPPRVGYSLSPLGLSLRTQLLAVSDWGVEHYDAIAASRKAFDAA